MRVQVAQVAQVAQAAQVDVALQRDNWPGSLTLLTYLLTHLLKVDVALQRDDWPGTAVTDQSSSR